MKTPLYRIETFAPRSRSLRIYERAALTAHEERIIREAVEAGRVTVLPPAMAMGLTAMEQRFGAPWIVASSEEATAAGRSNLIAARARHRRERTGAEAVQ
ncbi:MAG: hypothetical protein ACT6RD_03440 [Brevundimonas sp.]|uniref:hypothetical protein n=1 Tax=Brevundimonas sp. TaxID=1871086 RepID=UPI0040344341